MLEMVASTRLCLFVILFLCYSSVFATACIPTQQIEDMTSPPDGSPTPYSNSLQPSSTIPPDSETPSTPSSSTAITKLAGAKPIIPSFPSTSTTDDKAGSNEEDVDGRRLATITTTTTVSTIIEGSTANVVLQTGVNTVTMTTTTTMTNSGNNNQNVNSNMNNVQIVNNNMNNVQVVNNNMNNVNVVNVMNG